MSIKLTCDVCQGLNGDSWAIMRCQADLLDPTSSFWTLVLCERDFKIIRDFVHGLAEHNLAGMDPGPVPEEQ